MNKLLILIAYFGLCSCIQLLDDLHKDAYPADYQKLAEYVNIASLAYCIKHGLQPGRLGDDSTNCRAKRCGENPYKDIEVLAVFNFNDLGDVGTGYYALDKTGERIILAFRGTDSRRDWFANLDAFPRKYSPLINSVSKAKEVECPGCKVHKGFYNFLQNNCAEILSAIKDLKNQYPLYKLVVLGHSLGGAFALLSGIEFQLMDLDPLVITYASPKIGNKAMMKFVDDLFDTADVSKKSVQDYYFDSGYIRVVHEGDMVPLLPPTSLFVHGGVKYYIKGDGYHPSPKDLEREGFQVEEWDIMPKPDGLTKIMPIDLGKEAHSQYFIKITKCR